MTLEALSFYTERRHSLDSTNNPEIEDNDHSKKIEEFKVKLSRTIYGLEKSFVPNEELSTKLLYMMDQSEYSEDDFETENDLT